MRAAIIIPARLGSTRLPGKPLEKIGDLPLVVRVAKQAAKATLAVGVWVATDAEAIADVARAHGVEAILTRSDHPSGSDRVAEAAAILDAREPLDAVINVQGDEPFIEPSALDAIIDALARDSTIDISTLKTPITEATELHDPNIVKVVCNTAGQALYFSRSAIPYRRPPATKPLLAFRHVGVYGYRRQALRAMCDSAPHPLELSEGLEQLRPLAMGMHIFVADIATAPRGIDTPDDLAWAREHVRRGNLP